MLYSKVTFKDSKILEKTPTVKVLFSKITDLDLGQQLTQKGALLSLYLKVVFFCYFCKRFQGSVFTERQVTAYEYVEKT